MGLSPNQQCQYTDVNEEENIRWPPPIFIHQWSSDGRMWMLVFIKTLSSEIIMDCLWLPKL